MAIRRIQAIIQHVLDSITVGFIAGSFLISKKVF